MKTLFEVYSINDFDAVTSVTNFGSESENFDSFCLEAPFETKLEAFTHMKELCEQEKINADKAKVAGTRYEKSRFTMLTVYTA